MSTEELIFTSTTSFISPTEDLSWSTAYFPGLVERIEETKQAFNLSVPSYNYIINLDAELSYLKVDNNTASLNGNEGTHLKYVKPVYANYLALSQNNTKIRQFGITE